MRGIIWSIALLALAAPAPAQTRPTNATVTLKGLIEKRELSLEKTPFSGWENGVQLTLHVDGPDVQGARKYGKLQATSATDDVGTDLLKKGEGPKFNNDSFSEVREPQTFGFHHGKDPEPKPTGFDVELKLPTPPARSAKMITGVKGELQVVVGGEKKIVEVKPIKENMGKTIDDPSLKAVGIKFTIVDPASGAANGGGVVGAILSGGKTSKGVTVQITGNMDEIAAVAVVDSTGKKLSNSSWLSKDKVTHTITYMLDKPLPDDAALQIEVWPGQKMITVPFELKDVALP